MRGVESSGDSLFSYIRLEERIPLDHPLRAIRSLVDEVLDQMSGRFEQLYSRMGRPSIPPEHLLRATLVQAFYSVRSERMLMEQIDYNLLFRWFVGLPMDAQFDTRRLGIRRYSPRTATGCWVRALDNRSGGSILARTMWRGSFWRRCLGWCRCGVFCRTSTSRSMAR